MHPVAPFLKTFRDATAGPDNDLLKEFEITPKGINVKKKLKYGKDTYVLDKTMANLFDRLREAIKKTGKTGMFMYGMPSVDVITLLIRLYNENIIRTYYTHGDYDNIKIMIGVAEVGGNLYITLSEDPREDGNYAKKVKLLYSLLQTANYQVEYPEYNDFAILPENALSIKLSEMFPSTKINFEHQNGDKTLRVGVWNKVKEFLIANDAASYSRRLAPQNRVKFVHSINYLLTRRDSNSIRGSPKFNPESVMFTPFKRAQDVIESGPTGIYTCNNGSTCAESKMFSYLNHAIPGFVFSMIRGYSAFWLGDRQPPDHIIKSYNYVDHADPLFIEIRDEVMPIIRRSMFDTIDTVTPTNINNFIQLFALPCPGCFSNYKAYINNQMTKTDASDCVHVETMSQIKRIKNRLLTTRVGGSRKKRTVRHRRCRRNCAHATRHRRARK